MAAGTYVHHGASGAPNAAHLTHIYIYMAHGRLVMAAVLQLLLILRCDEVICGWRRRGSEIDSLDQFAPVRLTFNRVPRRSDVTQSPIIWERVKIP